jgi:biotin carboxylase
MFESIGVSEGPLWVEAFYKGGRFVFNEMGYRLGGSLTNYLVKGISGIDQMKVAYDAALGEGSPDLVPRFDLAKKRCIWPTHLRPGVIGEIRGLDEVQNDPAFAAVTCVHGVGDIIEDWGSAQQVFAYLHFVADDVAGLLAAMRRSAGLLSVRDVSGNEMLYALFDPWGGELPGFLDGRFDGKGV